MNFINNVEQNPDVLITEGTRIDDGYEFTEEDVYNNFIKDDLKLSERLLLVSFLFYNARRFYVKGIINEKYYIGIGIC